jgi:hypothetical protein
VNAKAKWIIACLGIVAGVLASAYLLRDLLIAPRIAALLQAALGRELGVDLAIGRLGGSLLADIEIEDLQTVTPGTQGPVTALAAKRLRIRYSIPELLAGLAVFVDGMRIEADGLQVELDLDRGDGSSPDTTPSTLFPLMIPAIQVRDGAVAVRWGALRTRWDGVTLDMEKRTAGARRIRLAAAGWSWSHPLLAAGESTVAADLTLAPDSIAINELNLGRGHVSGQGRLGLAGTGGPFPFEARLQLSEGGLSLAGDVSSSVLNVRLKSDPVEIEPIAALFRQPLSGRLAADIDLSVPFDRPEAASGRIQLDVLNARIHGVALATAGVGAAAADGWIRVADLKAASGHSRLTITDAAAPLRLLLDGAWEDLLLELSGRFALSSEDLPELVRMIGLWTGPPLERIPVHRLDLSGRLDAGDLRIPHAGLSAGSNRIQLQDLETRLPPAPPDTPLKGGLRVELADLEALSRLFPFVSSSGSVTADATIGGTFGRPEADAVVAAENLNLQGLHVGNVSMKVRCERQQVRVKTLTVRRGADALDGTATIRLPAGSIEAAEFSFAVADLEWIGDRLLPAAWTIGGQRPRIQGRARGQAHLSGAWTSPDGELAATVEDLRLNESPFGTGSVRMRKQGATVTADAIRLDQGGDRLELRGGYDIAAGRLGAVRLRIDCAEAAAYLGAFASPWNGVSGRITAMVDASGPVGQPDFTLDLFLERLRTGAGSLAETRILARGAGRRIDIETAETLTPVGRLQAAGSLVQSSAGAAWDAVLEAFSLDGEDLQLTMAQPARIRFEAGRGFWIDRFEAGGRQGRITVRGQLTPEGRSDLSVELAGLSGDWPARLAGIPVAVEGLDATLRLAGTTASPEISLAGTVRKLDAGGRPLTFAGRFDLAYANRRLRIDAFEWTGPEGHRVALTGALPVDPAGDRLFAPGLLSVSAEARLPDQELIRSVWPAWPIASGAIEAEMELEGTWAVPRGSLRVKGRDVNPADPSGFAPPGPYEARIEMAIEARRILFKTVEISGAHAELRGTGVWQDYPALDQWPPGRSWAAGTVALEGHLAAPDLGWLARGSKNIRRVAGRLEAEVKIDGPLRDPRLQADLRLTDGELRPEADMPPLQALNLQAGFTGRNFEIRHLQGELGGAPFQVTGTIEDILASGGGPRLNLRLNGDDLLLHRSPTLRARANVDLRLSGPLERLELSGALTLTDGLFTRPFGLAEGLTAGSARPKTGPGFTLFAIESPPFRDMRFDVQVGAARPFRIKNNLAKGAGRPDLRLVGTGDAPELVGKVYLDPTVLFLPAGRMQFDSGVILFEAVDPGRPRLDMTGTARMIGYDVTAVVEGPYDEPSVTLSSAPPLPDAELLALVLTGQPPKTPGSGTVEKRQGLNVAVFIGRDILMRMPGGGTTESLQTVLERFDVEVGRSVTRAGDETINARFRVADDVLREKDTLYLTGEKDVFDYFNAGVRIVFRFR